MQPEILPVQHRGSSGIYLIGDRRLWTAEPERPGALTAFVQLGAGDPRVNQIGGYVGGGITLSAPFASRADDRLGVAVASALMGSRFRRAEERAGSKTARAETTVELTHLHPLPWRRDVGTSYIGSSDEMVVKERYTQPRTAT